MATDPDRVSDDPARVAQIEALVGHPGEKWEALKEQVQDSVIRTFASVEDEWLALMWSLDAYRVARVVPRGMGDPDVRADKRLAAIYRGKGHWFGSLVALLLQNRTHQHIAPRQRVQGFSQMHQIDLAWPSRLEDPQVCVETKVTGAPAYPGTRARGSRADYTNRRKEMKFSATDLKLYRRQDETVIDHWGHWRENAPPRVYSLWAARLNAPSENVASLVREAKSLVETYLDGAGIFAWQENETGSAYQVVPIPQEHRVTTLDDVLQRLGAVIRDSLGPDGEVPEPVRPERRALAPEELPEDEPEQGTLL